jgi:hypothetical protein
MLLIYRLKRYNRIDRYTSIPNCEAFIPIERPCRNLDVSPLTTHISRPTEDFLTTTAIKLNSKSTSNTTSTSAGQIQDELLPQSLRLRLVVDRSLQQSYALPSTIHVFKLGLSRDVSTALATVLLLVNSPTVYLQQLLHRSILTQLLR